jgi:hypothetical protein
MELNLIYVKTKNELPNAIDDCSICFEEIDVDQIIGGVPNIIICCNGHRIHRNCLSKCAKYQCPVCRTNIIKNCKSHLGYSYILRK